MFSLWSSTLQKIALLVTKVSNTYDTVVDVHPQLCWEVGKRVALSGEDYSSFTWAQLLGQGGVAERL